MNISYLILIITIMLVLVCAPLFSTLLLNPAGNGGFELGATYADNGWTLANGTQVNKWEIGTGATGYTGARAAFISNNGGTNWTYTLTTAATVYFYRDIAFPSGEGDIQLSFDYRATGESTYDYVAVFLVPTSTTPTAGTLLSSGKIGYAYYNLTNEWMHTGISIPASNAGTTQRLVFCWRNDGSGGYDPPAVIDNIKLTSNPVGALSGNYYVDNTQATGGIYFNNLVDAVLMLNNNGVSGATEFRISTDQTFTNLLPHVTATGTLTNYITFIKYGGGNNPRLRSSGTGTTSAVPLDAGVAIAGGDWITFNGLDVELTGAVQTGASTYAYPLEYGYYVYNIAAGNGAQNNTVRNCKITLNRLNTSSIGIYQNVVTTPTSAAGSNTGNIYANVTIENVANGIYMKGAAAYPDDICQVNQCHIGGSTANDIGNGTGAVYGIRVDSGTNTGIGYNQIRNLTSTGSNSVDGIFVSNSGSGTVNVGTIQVSANQISLLNNTSTSAGRVCGMRVNLTGATGSVSRIYNNMIWGLNSSSTATSSRRIIGIFVQDAGSGTNSVHNVDFNSVRIDHSNLSTVSSAFEIGTSSGPVINTRSNVFTNFTGGQTGSPYHCAWASTSNTLIGNAGSVSNNNVLYVHNGANGYVGRGSTLNFASLTDWQNAMGCDPDSKSSNPQFSTVNDLHISDSTPTPVESNGIFQSWVTIDYDGHERNTERPDIGADEGDFQEEVECETPSAQPTDLILIPGITTITGSFTPSDAEGYLTVMHTESSHSDPPADQTTYSVGNTLGNGTIVGTGSGTTVNISGLSADTEYFFTVYAYNQNGLQAPKYLRDGPLTGSMQTLPAAPANPGSFTATVFSYQQINLAATANGNNDNIMVAWNTTATFGTPLATGYTEGSSIVGGGTVWYMGSASGLTNHTGLLEGTTYYYKAWSYTTAERATYYIFSSGLTSSATTPVSPQNVPIAEDFESITTAGSFPIGWTRSGTRWTSQVAPQTYNQAPRSGTDYLTCSYSATSSDWMFSRAMNLDASEFYDFGIWYNADGYSGWTSFKMYIGTAANGTAMTTELASVLAPANTSYAQLTKGAWQPPTSGLYYIGLQVIANSSPWYMCFDDFSVQFTPEVPVFAINPNSKAFGNQQINSPSAPQMFTISNVGAGQLVIDPAISIGGDDQSHFTLSDFNSYPKELDLGDEMYVSVSFNPTTEGAKSAYLNITDNVSGKVTHQIPLSGTGVDYMIHTGQLPYSQNFDSVTAPALPFGWSKVVSSSSAYAYVHTYTSSTPLSTPNHLYLTNSSDTAAELVAISPPIEPILKTIKIKFYAKAGGAAYPLQVGTMDGMGAKLAFSLHQTINLTTTYTQYEVSFGTYEGSDNCIAFRHGLGGTYRSIYIDNITIETIPTEPAFLLNPSSADFGDVQIQTSSFPEEFIIKNNGGGTLTINSVSIVGDDQAHYILEDLNEYPLELTADQSIVVNVIFHPGTVGPKNASLKIVDDQSKAEHFADLDGVGVDKTIYDLPYLQTLYETPQALYWQQFVIGAGVTDRWSVSSTSNAGGQAPEWKCGFQNINPGITRLVSPPVYTVDIPELIVKFRHQIDDYGVGCTYKLRYGYTIDSFFDVWTQASASNITYPSEEKVFTLGQDILAGHDRVYLCWEIEGNLFQYDNWYVDNIKFLTTNTEIGQVQATGATALVVIPEITVDGVPINPEVSFAGLTGNPLINVSASYGTTSDPLTNERLVLTIDGGNLAGVTVTFTHGLGFVPQVLAYQIGAGTTMLVNNPGDWTDTTAYFTIPSGKGPFTLKTIFPKDLDDTLPVELSSFTATITSDLTVKIAWTAQSETNHSGYNVLRAEANDLTTAIKINPSLIDNGTPLGTQISYSYTDIEAYSNMVYYYWLESVSLDGVSEFFGPLSITIGDPSQDPVPPLIPMATKLMNAFPNPFNPNTNIRYSLKEAGKVNISIYNVKGQLIKSINNDHDAPGYYQITWDGRDMNGKTVSSGIYMYRMTSGKYNEAKKMILAK